MKAPTEAALAAIVPRLTTPRLLLRELRATDFEAHAANSADPEAMKYMSGTVDRRHAWRVLAALTGAWLLTGAGWWGIEVVATGELVGTVGAFFRETTLGLGAGADIELGWSVYRPYWRRGYASEAARAALAWAFATHDAPRAVAHLVEANAASAGVCKAIGMTYDGQVDLYGEPCARYAMAAPLRGGA